MTTTKPERLIVLITDTTTRAELAETLRLVNDNAKKMSRRGFIGARSEAYACEHRRINALLEAWEDVKQ